MAKYGVFVTEQQTSVSTPVVADVGIPFVIGCAPIQAAESPAAVGVPTLCTSWGEFVSQFGWSDDWDTYNLCEVAYSHFKLYGVQPAIFVNLLDPSTMKTAVAADDMDVIGRKVTLPIGTIHSSVVVKAAGGSGDAWAVDTDYTVYSEDGVTYVELLATSSHANATSINIAYSTVNTATITAAYVASKMDTVDLCLSTIGMVPDIMIAPGYSSTPTVAAIMATKAAGINGLFRAKAIIDIDCSSATGAARTYSDVYTVKTNNNLVDENEILCWPMVKLGGYKFHLSTQLAGLMASVDTENGGYPYDVASNYGLKIDGLCLADGTAVIQTKAQADTLRDKGIVTALNFGSNGWVSWGAYTACYPANTDVKDYFISVSRMFDFVGNTLIQTFWSKVDRPMTRILLDNVQDTVNAWLTGLTGANYILGGRCEIIADENPVTNLIAGIIKFHIYMTPPVPAQEIDFVLEYDVDYLTAALS